MSKTAAIRSCITYFKLKNHDHLLTVSPQDAYLNIRTKGHIHESRLLEFFGDHLSFPFKKLSQLTRDESLLTSTNYPQFYQNRTIPLYKDSQGICLAVDTPFPEEDHLLSELDQASISFQLLQQYEFNMFWVKWKKIHLTNKDTKTTIELPPLLQSLLSVSHDTQASDIHLHQADNHATIFLRCQGLLRYYATLETEDYKQLSAIISYHANMPLGNTQHPQNGQLNYTIANTEQDARVSLLPTVHGCDIVIRLFQKSKAHLTLSELGFDQKREALITSMLSNNHGLILITGPTGSGKTTTLYTILEILNQHAQTQIITIEDPVERLLPKIRQTQINEDIGYGFKDAFKACLRQDPDVILIGEIRDADTAKLVIEAAYSGHLILATLHTNNCQNTLKRLNSFNLDPFLLGHCLKGIVSQQLKRVSCEYCNEKGCSHCSYSGVSQQLLV